MTRGPRSTIAEDKTQSDVKSQVNPSHASGGRLHAVQQSAEPSQENRGQASGDRVHFPGFNRNSRVTEPEASHLEDYLGCKKEQNASSSSVRNESQNPNVLASRDQLQSKEDDVMTNMLSPGVKFLPHFFRTGLPMGIPNEQISRHLHQRLSELFLLDHAGPH